LRVCRLVEPSERMIGCKVDHVGAHACGYPRVRFLAYSPQAPEVLPVAMHTIYSSHQVFGGRGSIIHGLDLRDIIRQVVEIPARRYVGPVNPLTSSISVVYQSLDLDGGSLAGTWARAVRFLIVIVSASLDCDDYRG
jgi:hypothetical protein